MIHRHRNWFPVILALLTILLVIVFIRKVSPSHEIQEQGGQPFMEEAAEPVSEDAYRESVTAILTQLDSDLEGAEDESVRALAAGVALDALLSERVPNLYRDLHLELAVLLNTMSSGELDGTDELEQLKTTYPWLP